jgi:pimeloyl-ACP methyl ester carboxylesterase
MPFCDANGVELYPDMVRMLSDGFQLARSGDAEAGPRLQLEARRHHDTASRLGQIGCPTLVCGGRYDGIAPPANSEFLAGAIPGARLEIFDGGHIFFMQDASAFPSMTAFLLGTEASRPLPDGGQADGAVSTPGA